MGARASSRAVGRIGKPRRLGGLRTSHDVGRVQTSSNDVEYLSGTERLFSDNAALVRSGRLARTACARSGDDVTTGGDIPQKGHVASVVPLDLTACDACVEPIVGIHEHSGEPLELSCRLVLRPGLCSPPPANSLTDI